jgi:UDP-4-amino-4,6-dideoxy-N-acetyl-beta-L-altrosamine transaminase
MKPIPYGRQDISEDDIDAVVKVLRSDFLTQGPEIPKFEKAIADYCSAPHAVAVSSATAALHIAVIALGIKPGDIVWTSPNSFVASANCALYAGATIDFVDIDSKTYNLNIDALALKLQAAEKKGTLPKLVIPVHFGGQSCNMESIFQLSKKYGFKILEDASHAVGGSYRDEKIGSCHFSDACVFSFHPVKIITTGEGGVVLTRNENVYRSLLRLRSHGITREPSLMTEPSHGPWYYQQLDLGWNYRLTDLQAALGSSQLVRLDEFIMRRHEIAQRYDNAFENLPVITPHQNKDARSSYHLYVLKLKLNELRKTQGEIFQALHEAGIMVNLHYIPIHLQPYYKHLGFHKGQFEVAEKYYSEAMSIPMYSKLTDDDQGRVIDTITTVLNSALRSVPT